MAVRAHFNTSRLWNFGTFLALDQNLLDERTPGVVWSQSDVEVRAHSNTLGLRNFDTFLSLDQSLLYERNLGVM
jgi:hypothetical protein